MRAAVLAVLLLLGVSAVLFAGHWIAPKPGISTASTKAPDGARGELGDGVLALGALAEVWQTTRAASLERLVQAAALNLEQWIVTWRDQALEDGTQAIPSPIRERLVGYFSDRLLDRVRYRVGWGEGRPMQANLFRLFGARAVSLGEVIIFRDAGVAADPVIWAHELAHVQQYESWGTREFAERYVRDHHAVESEAWEVAAAYTMWALQQGKLASAAPAGPARPERASTDR